MPQKTSPKNITHEGKKEVDIWEWSKSKGLQTWLASNNSDALNYIPKNVQGLDQLNNTSPLRVILLAVTRSD